MALNGPEKRHLLLGCKTGNVRFHACGFFRFGAIGFHETVKSCSLKPDRDLGKLLYFTSKHVFAGFWFLFVGVFGQLPPFRVV